MRTTSSTVGRQRRDQRTAFAPRASCLVEALESRTLLTAVSWIANSSGDFNNPANWSTGKVPGVNDDVTIDKPSTHVRLANETQNVNSLTTTTPLDFSGSSLIVNGGGVALMGGATITEDTGSHLSFFGTQTLGGMGTIFFSGSNGGDITIAEQVAGGHLVPDTLTLAAGIMIHGGDGTIGSEDRDASIDNQATIVADTPGTTIGLAGTNMGSGTLTSSGYLAATAGELDISGNGWTNTGTIAVSGAGTLGLGGGFDTAEITNLVRSGGTVNLGGALENSGRTLALDSVTLGSWNLIGGGIVGGTITSAGGATLTVSSGDFYGVALGPGTPVVVADSGTLLAAEGITLNNTTLNIGTGGVLQVFSDETLGGSGTIDLDAATLEVLYAPSNSAGPGALTIGPSITVQGTNGNITLQDSDVTVNNFGTIASDTPAQSLSLATNGGTFSNTGTVEASDGGTLSLQGDYNAQPQGAVHIGIGANGSGTFAISGAANLSGTLDVTLVNNFVPPLNQTYNLLTYAASSGAFSAINLPTATDVEFTATTGPTGISVVTSTPPPPTIPELVAQVTDDRVMLSQATMTRRRTMADLIHTRNQQVASLRTARRQLLQLQRENKKHPSDSLAAEIGAVTTQIDDLSQQLGDTQQSLAADRTTDFTGITAARHNLSADLRTLHRARLQAKKHA